MKLRVKKYKEGGSEEKNEPSFPPNHKVGMKVTKGGSCCANCEYVNGNKCTNEYFIKWKGGDVIPAPTDQYCCDFWEADDDDDEKEEEPTK